MSTNTMTDDEIAAALRAPGFAEKLNDVAEMLREGAVDIQKAALALGIPPHAVGAVAVQMVLEKRPSALVRCTLGGGVYLIMAARLEGVVDAVEALLKSHPDARVDIIDDAPVTMN